MPIDTISITNLTPEALQLHRDYNVQPQVPIIIGSDGTGKTLDQFLEDLSLSGGGGGGGGGEVEGTTVNGAVFTDKPLVVAGVNPLGGVARLNLDSNGALKVSTEQSSSVSSLIVPPLGTEPVDTGKPYLLFHLDAATLSTNLSFTPTLPLADDAIVYRYNEVSGVFDLHTTGIYVVSQLYAIYMPSGGITLNNAHATEQIDIRTLGVDKLPFPIEPVAVPAVPRASNTETLPDVAIAALGTGTITLNNLNHNAIRFSLNTVAGSTFKINVQNPQGLSGGVLYSVVGNKLTQVHSHTTRIVNPLVNNLYIYVLRGSGITIESLDNALTALFPTSFVFNPDEFDILENPDWSSLIVISNTEEFLIPVSNFSWVNIRLAAGTLTLQSQYTGSGANATITPYVYTAGAWATSTTVGVLPSAAQFGCVQVLGDVLRITAPVSGATFRYSLSKVQPITPSSTFSGSSGLGAVAAPNTSIEFSRSLLSVAVGTQWGTVGSNGSGTGVTVVERVPGAYQLGSVVVAAASLTNLTNIATIAKTQAIFHNAGVNPVEIRTTSVNFPLKVLSASETWNPDMVLTSTANWTAFSTLGTTVTVLVALI